MFWRLILCAPIYAPLVVMAAVGLAANGVVRELERYIYDRRY